MKKALNFLLLSVFVIFFFVGCSASKNESDNATLSFISDQVLTKSFAPGNLTIDTVKILVTRIKFDSQGDVDSSDFENGPIVIYLDLSGNVQTVSASNIPQGTYDRIKFEIHKPDQDEDLPDPDFRTGSGGNERYSMIVIGTYSSNRFVFKSRSTINQSINIDPALIVADSVGTANLTLAVNVPNWFSNGSGGYLNPTDVFPNNIAAIENTIKYSFRAFRDNNRDGKSNTE